MKRYRDIAGDGGSDIAAQIGEQQARLAARFARIRFAVTVLSGKGGVGKSAVTANLASALALRGWRAGVLDADLNGPSMAKMLGVRGRTLVMAEDGVAAPETSLGVKVMSMDLLLPSDESPLVWQAPTQQEAHTWRGAMEANALREFLADTSWGELDILLLDLPPGTDKLATVASLLPKLSGAVVVTIPSDVSQLVVKKSLTAATQMGAPVLGLVENMAGLFRGPDARAMADAAAISFLGSVPFDVALADAADRGEPFVSTYPERDAAIALTSIAATIRSRLETGAA